jgi:hypothetical protein
MSITKGKKIFDVLEKLYTNKYDIINMEMYERIINITFVYIGIRTVCEVYFKNSNKEIEIFDEIKTYSKNMRVIQKIKKLSDDTLWYRYFFINLKMIDKYNLSNEYNNLLNDKYDHIDIGKLLGYACPLNIFEHYDIYLKRDDNNLRRRYVYEYFMYKKDGRIIILEEGCQLFAYICYDDKKNKKYYEMALRNLKLYQTNLLLITDKFHIGFKYSEEIL